MNENESIEQVSRIRNEKRNTTTYPIDIKKEKDIIYEPLYTNNFEIWNAIEKFLEK